MPLDLKEFVKRHETRGEKKYSPSELHELCSKSIEVFKKEPTMLKIESPVAVAGNTYGCFNGVIRFCELYECHKLIGGDVKKKLFIGNYSGSGGYSVETISCILGLKLRYHNEVFVLRGNEEHLKNSEWHHHSMQQQLIKKFGEDEAEKLLLHLSEVYSWMPLAALVDGKIFCVHGGIPPQLKSLEEIQKISRPLLDPSKNSLVHFMLNAEAILDSRKPTGPAFYEDDVRKSLRVLGLSKIIRTDEVYSTITDAIDHKMYSISSAYTRHENIGSMIFVSKKEFQLLTYQDHFVNYEGKNPETYFPDPVQHLRNRGKLPAK